jgi:hypothetical protein
MQLNQEDMQAWMEERGPGMGGGFPGEGDISEEEREAVRATRQAGFGGEGMSPGGEMPPEMATLRAQFENMSEEERQAMMATARAGGGIGDGFRGGAGGPTGTTAGGLGQARLLLRPLIGLLSERAGGNGS